MGNCHVYIQTRVFQEKQTNTLKGDGADGWTDWQAELKSEGLEVIPICQAAYAGNPYSE